MANYDRKTIEFYISDVGVNETMNLFHITEKEINNILDDKVFGESSTFKFRETSDEYIEWEPVYNPELHRVIVENYKMLRTYAVKNKWTINSRGISQEDMFHSMLLSALKSKTFQYINDELTLHFIRTSLKKLKIDVLRRDIATRLKTADIGILNDNRGTLEAQFEYENEAMNTLTSKQKSVLNLLLEGYNQVDVSTELGIKPASVTGHLRLIRKKFEGTLS